MSGQDEGPGGVVEPGSGAEHKEDDPGPERGAQGQMELDALRSFVEVGLHNVDVRLDVQADMLAQMQGMLQDAVLPGQAAGGRVVQEGAPVGIAEGSGGPIAGVAGPGELPGGAAPLAVAGPGSHAEKMAAKARLGLWQNPTSRKYWMIAGERPSLTGAKRQEIQDLLQKRMLVTGDIATQLEILSGFDVAGYIPRSATANSIAEYRFRACGPTRHSFARSVHSGWLDTTSTTQNRPHASKP